MQYPVVETAQELDTFLSRFLRRFSRVNGENCDRFADAFARTFKFTECPREVRHIVQHLGIRLQPAIIAQPGQACWQRINSHYAINYSRYASVQNAAFSIMHEIFEIIASHRDFPTSLPPYKEERLANCFAAQFLMPEQEVRAEAVYYLKPDLRRYLIPKLADRFQVSRSAMKIRLLDLGIVPREK